MMQTLTLISGSTLGKAEDLAEHLLAILVASGFSIKLFHGATLQEVTLNGVWLLVTSTHGAGSLPDNLLPMFEELKATTPNLCNLRYGIIGLGDRSYDTFCQASITADQILTDCGAKRLGTRLEIDVSSDQSIEDLAQTWLQTWLSLPLDSM